MYLCLKAKQHTLSLSPGAYDQKSSGCHSVAHSPNQHSCAAITSVSHASGVQVASPLSPPHPPSDLDSSPPKSKKLRMCIPPGSSLDMPNVESEVHKCTCTCR